MSTPFMGLQEQNMVYDARLIDQGRNVENPRSIKIDVYDPLGRASIIEDNLRGVFRKLNNGRGVNCMFSIGISQNKMYMDNFQDLVLHINDKYALTNKDRFRLDRPLSDPELEEVSNFMLTTFEVACGYRF